jgi:hypothetical protein
MNKIVYIVTSREAGPVFVTIDRSLAELKMKDREYIEEMQGGRPSIYIVELQLN